MPLSDLFKQIREYYKTHPLTIDNVDCGNIITRDQTRFLSEDPERWRKKFHRQCKHNTRGLFARNNVPYRALGDDVTHNALDAEELIWKTLKMPAKKITFQYANIGNDQGKQKGSKFVKMPDLIPLPKKYEERDNLPASIHGGMSAINLVLKECNQRRLAQKKGVWYEDAARAAQTCSDELQKKQAQVSAIQPPVRENFISPQTRSKLKPLPSTVADKESNLKARVIKNWMDFQRIPSLLGNNRVDISVTDTIGHLVGGEAPLGVQFRSDGSVIPLEEIIRSNKMKAKNDHIAKLNCIYQILCCLHNLKTKDLKSQHLLEPAALKVISQKPLKKEPPLRPLTRMISVAPVCSCISHTASNTMPGHVTWATTDSFIRPCSGGHNNNQPLLKKTSLPSIDAWLDLIEGVDGATDSHSELTASVISQLKQYPLYKMLHNTGGATVTFNGQQLQFSAQQIRNMPPWKKILYFKDLYEDAASLEEQRKKSITEVIESCVKSFEISRNSMARTVRDEIEVMKRNSRNILTSKWKCLQLTPISGNAIVSMRLNAYKMMCQRKSNYDTRPNWFLDLKGETMSICGDSEDPVRDNALIKLQQFSHFDDRTVQFVEQKLFLLVLSLPAHELCTKSMIQALRYVLKKVLNFEPAILEEWIQYRKLPNLFVDDCK